MAPMGKQKQMQIINKNNNNIRNRENHTIKTLATTIKRYRTLTSWKKHTRDREN